MTAPARPGDRPTPRALASVALPCALVSALVVGGAVAAAPSSVRLPLGLGAGAAAILLCAALTAAVHAVRAERATRRLLAAARAEADAERARAAATAERERDALVDDFTRERERLAEQRDREVARLTEETARLGELLKQATGERAAAVSATANAAGRMQALATGMLADLRAMEERHSDEAVLADLLHLDHRTAQAGRLADSVAVLTGARSGRRWARPIGMESILRGAMGRIAGYRRVRVHSSSDTAVAGHAAEGVMHALAELLDNAANFSPPTAEIHVYVEEVPAGVIVSVEDSGLVMGEVQLRQAQQAVAGETAGLGGLTGTRLGLAVVGRLAAKYGLKVSFRPSARGGTGVLMLVPQDILSGPALPAAPGATPAATPSEVRDDRRYTPEPPAAEPAPAEAAPEPPPVHDLADQDHDHDRDQAPRDRDRHGQDRDRDQEPKPDREPDPSAEELLPKRRRGRTLAAAERARAAARSAEPRATPSADDAKVRAARFSSFRQAVRTTTGATTGAAAEPAETAPDLPSHSSAHPEGDTTP
ncbi:ATP-binding protein [Streptomyces violaceoruber]|uniref:ATP-binding protein n=1 Tax=Streptomyces violaceoruber TaxID=1935 RepID=A0ACD4WER4_STRVN|nr:ATP-binding protein [Streptomyces violaceoruber]BDD76803.1 histidine kinase [Streptomyces coelicolor]